MTGRKKVGMKGANVGDGYYPSSVDRILLCQWYRMQTTRSVMGTFFLSLRTKPFTINALRPTDHRVSQKCVNSRWISLENILLLQELFVCFVATDQAPREGYIHSFQQSWSVLVVALAIVKAAQVGRRGRVIWEWDSPLPKPGYKIC